MDYKELADLIFPDAKEISYYEEKYPERNLPEGAMVTRFAPSPTGFVHMGSLLASFISRKAAKDTKGVFYLRIEDTDQTRKVEGVIDFILTHYPGDTITEEMRGLLTQITVRVLGYVDSKDQLCEAMQFIGDKIQIISTEGENLLLPGIQLADIEGMVI